MQGVTQSGCGQSVFFRMLAVLLLRQHVIHQQEEIARCRRHQAHCGREHLTRFATLSYKARHQGIGVMSEADPRVLHEGGVCPLRLLAVRHGIVHGVGFRRQAEGQMAAAVAILHAAGSGAVMCSQTLHEMQIGKACGGALRTESRRRGRRACECNLSRKPCVRTCPRTQGLS